MQLPTCQRIHVRSSADAERIFHGVYMEILPMVRRRLDTDERRAIHSGCVYVWEERGSNADALGIERWTDSISWGPSRVRDIVNCDNDDKEFLFYHERRPVQPEDQGSISNPGTMVRRRYRPSLVKQTYSVYVNSQYGRRKWHMIAYFTQETVDQLGTVDDIPALSTLVVPRGMYTCARSANRGVSSRRRHPRSPTTGGSPSRSPSESHSLRLPKHPRNPDATLAPLEYLETVAPPPRHAMDESAIMSFSVDIDLSGSPQRYMFRPKM